MPSLSATTTGSRALQALAASVAGLAVVAAVGLGWWAPHVVRSHAEQTAQRDLDAATVALLTRCEQVGDAATALARQVAQYAAYSNSVITPSAATAAASSSALSRRDITFAVLGPDLRPLAVEGAATGRAAAAAGGYDASCSAGRAASNGREVGLAERYPVHTHQQPVGWVVAWFPLTDQSLAALHSGSISILGARGPEMGRVVAGAESGAESDVGHGGWVRARSGPRAGLPYSLASSSPVRGVTLLRGLALVVLAVGLIVPLSTYPVAVAKSRRLTDQLRFTSGELAVGQHLLADTFAQFGRALEHTHDLEGLLDSVVSACVNASGAVAGVVMLVDAGHSGHLMPLGSARTDSPLAGPAAAALPGLAEQFLAWASEPGGGLPGGPPTGPLLTHLPAAGPALAVPMSHDGRLVGVLAVARGEGARAFDALAPMRVREIAAHAGTAVENVRTHEEVRRLSVTDPLTGVGNVRQLSTILSREVAGALRFDRRLTVLMLDLDHFKQVNDTLGHQFGDFVLREFAHRLLACVREMDTVARYGGEEFAIVLPETDVDGGSRVAERVMTEMRRAPFRQGEVEYPITVSIGVAGFPLHGRSVAEVLESADAALYAAKRDGRDRWQVAPGPAESAAPRVSAAG